MLAGILKNHDPESAIKWELACQRKGIEYRTIDITKNSWLEDFQKEPFDLFLLRPPCDLDGFKRLYDERLYIICKELGFETYPSYKECMIYENKRLLSYFLKANHIPHPETDVFYNFEDALLFIKTSAYPVVAKTNIGAAGSGVKLILNKEQGIKYIKKAFKGTGIRRRLGPNTVTGTPSKWFVKALKDPKYFKKKVISYIKRHRDTQYGFVIFQEYIPHDFEWRVVRIGDSFFAYKKFKVEDKSSGAKCLGFENPPLEMLNFIRELSDQNDFKCAAFDLFPVNNKYLVNEIQTIFGHIKDHILEVNGKPGRYLYKNNKWIFEEGDFNTNESYDLRLEHAINCLKVEDIKPLSHKQ